MNIGEPVRTIVVEPLELPEPLRREEPVPAEAPVSDPVPTRDQINARIEELDAQIREPLIIKRRGVKILRYESISTSYKME